MKLEISILLATLAASTLAAPAPYNDGKRWVKTENTPSMPAYSLTSARQVVHEKPYAEPRALGAFGKAKAGKAGKAAGGGGKAAAAAGVLDAVSGGLSAAGKTKAAGVLDAISGGLGAAGKGKN